MYMHGNIKIMLIKTQTLYKIQSLLLESQKMNEYKHNFENMKNTPHILK